MDEALGCQDTAVGGCMFSSPPGGLAAVSLTGQPGQECLQKVMKEEPTGEVCPEVSFYSSLSCIIDEHSINF